MSRCHWFQLTGNLQVILAGSHMDGCANGLAIHRDFWRRKMVIHHHDMRAL